MFNFYFFLFISPRTCTLQPNQQWAWNIRILAACNSLSGSSRLYLLDLWRSRGCKDAHLPTSPHRQTRWTSQTHPSWNASAHTRLPPSRHTQYADTHRRMLRAHSQETVWQTIQPALATAQPQTVLKQPRMRYSAKPIMAVALSHRVFSQDALQAQMEELSISSVVICVLMLSLISIRATLWNAQQPQLVLCAWFTND